MLKQVSLHTLGWSGLLLGLTLSLIACKHDPVSDTPPADPTPTVEFSKVKPEAGDTFDFGEEVEIKVTLEANVLMHGYDIYIINLTTTDTVAEIKEHPHDYILEVEESWINNVTQSSDMRVVFEIPLNHEGEQKNVHQVDFHCLAE